MSKKEPKELNVQYLLEQAKTTKRMITVENKGLFPVLKDSTNVPVRVIDIKEGFAILRPNSKRSQQSKEVPFDQIFIRPPS